MLRWLTINLRTFLLALALALAVWVTAVIAADPDETQVYPQPIAIQYSGLDPSLIISGTVPKTVQVELRAPRSIWEKLNAGEATVEAVVDLSGLGIGSHPMNVQIHIGTKPVRVVSVTPEKIDVTLETLVSVTLPIELNVIGEPAIGYSIESTTLDPIYAVVSGPESVMARVHQLSATLDVTDARQGMETSLQLTALDSNQNTVSNVSVSPELVKVNLTLVQMGGYRDLAVKVVTIGQLSSGYRLINITASPLIVTVFSDNVALISALPGYVETSPLDLTNASGNINTNLALALPAGVSLVGDQTVAVQIEIVPIEGSLKVSYRPVEVVGLTSGLKAQLSPTTVDVILSGPLPALNSLLVTDVHVRIDLTGLGVGTYQLTPTVTITNPGVVVQSILPAKVEVVITSSTIPTP